MFRKMSMEKASSILFFSIKAYQDVRDLNQAVSSLLYMWIPCYR